MEAGQRSPDSSSEECTVLEAPPPRNTCLRHAAKVRAWGTGLGQEQQWTLPVPPAGGPPVLRRLRPGPVRGLRRRAPGPPHAAPGPGPAAAAPPPAGGAELGAEQAAPGVGGPEPGQGAPAAAERPEGLHGGGHPVPLPGPAQAAGRAQERAADGAGGHLRPQAEGASPLRPSPAVAAGRSPLRRCRSPPGPGGAPGPGGEDMVSSCSRCQEVLEGEACVAGLQAEREVEEQLLQAAHVSASCQPEENHQLDLLMDTDALRKSVHNLGTIVTTSAVASQSEAMGAGLEECLVGHPASVTVVTRDKSGGACKSGNAVLSAEVFTPDGSIVDGELVDHNNGTYEFVYVIPREGDFSLALRLYDQHIKGSPFRLKVRSQVEVSPSATATTNSAAYATPSTGSSDGAKRRGKSPAQKKKASKRASSALGTPRRRTQNPIEDDLIFKIGEATFASRKKQRKKQGRVHQSAGRRHGNLQHPDRRQQQPVCAGTHTRTHTHPHTHTHSGLLPLQIFSNHGEFRNRFGVRGRSPGQLQRPTGVAVHPSGDIIIADYDNKWVSIFSCDGKFKAKLGSGRLLGPKGVSVDQNGHVIVVDNKACSVFVFQLSGKLVAKFGSRGNGDTQLAGWWEGVGGASTRRRPQLRPLSFRSSLRSGQQEQRDHRDRLPQPLGEGVQPRRRAAAQVRLQRRRKRPVQRPHRRRPRRQRQHRGGRLGQQQDPGRPRPQRPGGLRLPPLKAPPLRAGVRRERLLPVLHQHVGGRLYGPQGLALTSDGHVVVADSGNHCFKVYRYLQ
ncbi:unnamed protein product, partial [Tetraodon nigroviridis]